MTTPDSPVATLMQAVQQHAAAAGPEPRFPLLALAQAQPSLIEASRVEPRPLLIGRSLYERLWVVINRSLRRVACHAVEPAVAQQNEWNAAVRATLDELARSQAELQAEITRLRAERHG